MNLLHIGAGNIGRSFVGPLFLNAGHEVVFADVNTELVDELNRRGSYDLVVCHPDKGLERKRISGVRAINANDSNRLRHEAMRAYVISTSVGAASLPRVLDSVFQALKGRTDPVDLLFAENAPGIAELARECMAKHQESALPPVGLIETSIGKMVPIMPEEIRKADPLQVRAEPYNILICDAEGWVCGLPDVPGLHGVKNISAYVHRKLFVHNLGHGAVAYLGYQNDPNCTKIADALQMPIVRSGVAASMECAVKALSVAYPEEFTLDALTDHVQDLITRFENPWLGDTIYRVGRDLPRKLGRTERIIGAMQFCIAHGVEPSAIASVAAAALGFRATDEHGALFPSDYDFVQKVARMGPIETLKDVSHLSENNHNDSQILCLIRRQLGAHDLA